MKAIIKPHGIPVLWVLPSLEGAGLKDHAASIHTYLKSVGCTVYSVVHYVEITDVDFNDICLN